MVRFTESSIVIEIKSTAPFEHLAVYQESILKIINMARADGYTKDLETTLCFLSNLLQEMNLNQSQMFALDHLLENAPREIKDEFLISA